VLPAFTRDGILPEGCHSATWQELCDRFGGTDRRDRLLEGLRLAGSNLRDAGATRLWLGGSFVTAKLEPQDFDAVWSMTSVDLRKVDPLFLDEADLRNGRLRQKAKYGGELFAGTEAESGQPFQVFFQMDRDGKAKGIVRLDLRTMP
jgi:hypothetical protein